jgi:TonB family protein
MIIYYLVAMATVVSAPEVVTVADAQAELEALPSGYTRSPDTKVSPIPTGNPGNWVNTDDYPSGALREEREGVVEFRLEVATSGTVSKCEVVKSSGHLDLDTTACDMISKRARFTPAKNYKGKPIVGYYYNRVRWVLPKTMPVPVSGQSTLSFIIEKDGSVSNCKISSTYPEIKNQDNICEQIKEFDIPRDAKGKPVRKSVATSNVVIVKDIPDTAKTGN